MTFARMEMLLLIWLVPLLLLAVLYGGKRRRRILSDYAFPRGLAAMVPESGNRRRRLKAGLFLAAVALSAAAAAGPRHGYRWEEVARKGVDIIVALDCSRSMLADDIRPSRLDRAKREVIDLLNMLQGDRVGLVAFAGTAFLQCPLTVDYDTFHLFLDTLTPDFLPVGGTDLESALRTAIAGFNEKDYSEKAVILITDGENTVAEVTAPAEAAQKAGVKVFCIGIGSAQGVPLPDPEGGFKKDRGGNIVLSRLNEGPLKQIALATGGAYVRSVAGDSDLEAIYFDQIREKMDLQTLETRRRQVWNDRYQWFLAAAVVLLLVELGLPVRRRPFVAVALAMALLAYPPAGRASEWKNDLEKGAQAYEKEHYDIALKHFIDAQLNAPERPEIFYNVGNAHYRLGDYEAALENYRQAQESEDPGLRQKALFNGGNASFRLNRLQEAIAAYRKALEIDPGDRDARMNLEFARRRLAQQQRQSRQEKEGQPSNGDKGEKAYPGNRGSDDSGSQERSTAEGASQNGADDASKESVPGQTPQDEAPASYARQAPAQQAFDETGQGKPRKGSAGASGDEETAGGRNGETMNGTAEQAQRMLNRLKDMPGRAMIPAYGKREVENDW